MVKKGKTIKFFAQSQKRNKIVNPIVSVYPCDEKNLSPPRITSFLVLSCWFFFFFRDCGSRADFFFSSFGASRFLTVGAQVRLAYVIIFPNSVVPFPRLVFRNWTKKKRRATLKKKEEKRKKKKKEEKRKKEKDEKDEKNEKSKQVEAQHQNVTGEPSCHSSRKLAR